MSALPQPQLLRAARSAQTAGQDIAAASFAWSEAQAAARGRSASRDMLALLGGALGFCDATIIFAASLLAYSVRHGLTPIPLEIVSTTALAGLLTANALSAAGAYTRYIRESVIAQIWQAARAWTAVFLLLLTIGYLTKSLEEFSRVYAILWFAVVLAGLFAIRLIAAAQLRRWRIRGKLATTVAIVDLAGCGAEFARRLSRNSGSECHLLGVFSPESVSGARSGIADLVALSSLFRIDDVFVLVGMDPSRPCMSSAELSAVLRRLGTIPTNVRLCPQLPMLDRTPIRDAALVHDIPTITVHRRPLGAWSGVVKRIEDLAIGSVALLLFLPVMAIIAIAIKLDSPGPILFRQTRQGFNNNAIGVLKFRSMTHTPVADGPDADAPVIQATRNDRRVTRVGRFLRRTSLDELPQLFNVLRGEMSLVGPRPHAVVHNQQYAALIDDYLGRHRVQPGITGWAQINGLRGETKTLDKMQRRVEYDLSYIDNWSIALDLKIIFLTAALMLFDREAY